MLDVAHHLILHATHTMKRSLSEYHAFLLFKCSIQNSSVSKTTPVVNIRPLQLYHFAYESFAKLHCKDVPLIDPFCHDHRSPSHRLSHFLVMDVGELAQVADERVHRPYLAMPTKTR
mmetsp:Transcript_33222/g.69883  ORF Transcript_33222/g.69883 Transcript_33222/m.69883 type:complete len:117 (-) Transcript_33222:77-427(-)